MIHFDQLKQSTLSTDDKSPKGSWDAPLLPLLETINAHPDHFSTSCCSGRITVYQGSSSGEAVNGKGHGHWLLCEHDKIEIPARDKVFKLLFGDADTIVDSSKITTKCKDDAVLFRFEAMVIHITSRTIEAGSQLLRASIEAGFRNSGLVISTSGRITVGIRPAPSGLSVPIAVQTSTGQLVRLIDEDYAIFLLEQANEHMTANLDRIQRLTENIERTFAQKQDNDDWEDAETRKARKRKEGLDRQSKLHRTGQAREQTTAYDNDLSLNQTP